jgi:enoyl-CoA hydratase/carnithine racemase
VVPAPTWTPVASWPPAWPPGRPLALSTTKRLLNQSAQVTLAQALEAEAQAQSVNLASATAGRWQPSSNAATHFEGH